jgi:hypothetical protein
VRDLPIAGCSARDWVKQVHNVVLGPVPKRNQIVGDGRRLLVQRFSGDSGGGQANCAQNSAFVVPDLDGAGVHQQETSEFSIQSFGWLMLIAQYFSQSRIRETIPVPSLRSVTTGVFQFLELNNGTH